MAIIEKINRIERLHRLLVTEKTGTPQQLAERLGVSRASLYHLIDELSSYNSPVTYSRKHETFFYEKNNKTSMGYKLEVLDNDENRTITGGYNFINVVTIFI